MKVSFPSSIHSIDLRSGSFSASIKAFLLLMAVAWSGMAMAQDDPIRNIRPGVNTFKDAIESNPGREYEIKSWNSANLVDGVYVTFSYQELVFPELGIELTSQEVRGKKFRLKPAKAEIIKVQFSKPKLAVHLLREMVPELSKIPFPNQSQKAVEKALGQPSSQSAGHLRYASMGLDIYFYNPKGARKQERIRHIFLTPLPNPYQDSGE